MERVRERKGEGGRERWRGRCPYNITRLPVDNRDAHINAANRYVYDTELNTLKNYNPNSLLGQIIKLNTLHSTPLNM